MPPADATESPAARVRTVIRAYGDGAVVIGSEAELRIRFRARAGDLVRLGGRGGCPVRLTGPGVRLRGPGHRAALTSVDGLRPAGAASPGGAAGTGRSDASGRHVVPA